MQGSNSTRITRRINTSLISVPPERSVFIFLVSILFIKAYVFWENEIIMD